MRNNIHIFVFASIILACAASGFADVKVKAKQTISGQSYESTTYIKGKRQRSESFGGMVNITQCDLRRGVQLNTNTKTYMVNPFATVSQSTTQPAASAADKNGLVETGGHITTTVTVRDTGERKQMFGYTARHLIITMDTVSSPDACNKMNSKMQTDGWYIDAAFVLDCDNGSAYVNYNPTRKAGGCRDKYDYKAVGTAKRGYPVYERTTMFDENGKEAYSMINEVVELSQATLDAGLFDVPDGFREVTDASQMYASSTSLYDQADRSTVRSANSESRVASSIKSAARTPEAPQVTLGPKKPGTVRIGVPAVKTGAVGDGIRAADLSAAVHNTFVQQLKMSKVEVVALDAKADTAMEDEARAKDCDYIISAFASHKKGGGGFGMFKSLAPMMSSVASLAGATGSVAGGVAGTVASEAIISTATVAGQVKNKDEITLDVQLTKTGGAVAFGRVFRAKAKSDGDDIISQLVAQAAQAVADTISKS